MAETKKPPPPYEGDELNTCLARAFDFNVVHAVIAIAITLLCGIAGIAIALAMAPAETSIDEGWRLAWIGLASGLFIEALGYLWLRRRRRTA